MGIFRYLFAISVVLAHSNSLWGIKMVGGEIAVQSFFIISGFYMSLILDGKYSDKKYSMFITSRFLRIFPMYWLVLLLSVVVFWALNLFAFPSNFAYFHKYFGGLDIITQSYILISNFVLFGQDLSLFTGLNLESGTMHFIRSLTQTNLLPTYNFMLVPQAWTLSLELTFYLIAPIILKKNIKLVLILIGFSFLLRLILYFNGFFMDPWTYRFFPTELLFFLLGNISFRIFKNIHYLSFLLKYTYPLFLINLLIVFYFSYLPVIYLFHFSLFQWLFYILFCFSLPFFFRYIKDSSFDQSIGELSYPIYISHIFIIQTLTSLFPILVQSDWFGFISVAASTVFSIVLIKIIRPIEKFRQLRIHKPQSTIIKEL